MLGTSESSAGERLVSVPSTIFEVSIPESVELSVVELAAV